MTDTNTSQGQVSRAEADLCAVLSEAGYAHLRSEGFTTEQCSQLVNAGWRWIDSTVSAELGFGLTGPTGVKTVPSGLLMPLGEGFTQLRCDEPLPKNRDGKPVKYLTLAGQRPVLTPTSDWLARFRPEGDETPLFLTEGAKDGMIATLHGVPMGVLAGVSHVRKALAEGCRWNLLFDSDGWTNPQVFCQLYRGALHTRGRVQILPQIEGQPKAGLCEYFASGQTASDLRNLLSRSLTPTDLLLEWPRQLQTHPDELGRIRCVRMAFALAFTTLKAAEQQMLLAVMHRYLDRAMGAGNITRLWDLEKARWRRIQRRNGEENPSQLATLYRRMQDRYSKRVRLNQRLLQLEMDGRPIERFGTVQLDVANVLQVDAPLDHIRTVVTELAEKNAYDPVREYLARVEREYICDSRLETFWNQAAWRYFGNPDPLVAKYLKKWAVSAVKRTLEPGCKVDTALFLRGDQGYRKSSFFQALCEDETWFTDSMDSVDKDGLLTAHRHWIIEWAELETVFKKTDQSFVKSFMSRTRDMVRAPYGEQYIRYARKFVLVGTTNESEFLTDPTGSRRFWVVEVKQPIPIDTVIRERDLFWAAAVYAAREEQEAHYLNEVESAGQAAANEAYASSHPWAMPIAQYLRDRGLTEVTVSELYTHIQPDLSRQDRKGQMVISEILQRLHWRKGERKRIGNLRVYPWHSPDWVDPEAVVPTGLTSTPVVPTSDEGLGQSQNPDGDSVSAGLSQPSQPFPLETDPEKIAATIEPDFSRSPASIEKGLGRLGQESENPVPDSDLACPNPRPNPPAEVGTTAEVGTEPASLTNGKLSVDRESSTPEEPGLDPELIARFVLRSEWTDPLHPRASNGRAQFYRVMRIEKSRVWLWQLYEGSKTRPQSVGNQSVPLTEAMAQRLLVRV